MLFYVLLFETQPVKKWVEEGKVLDVTVAMGQNSP